MRSRKPLAASTPVIMWQAADEAHAVAALSVGSTTDRMTAERNAVIANMLKDEARTIAGKLNPFDPTLRRAGAAMEMAG